MSLVFTSSPGLVLAHPQKVVVVGAGIAGLTCAYHLHKEGMDVDCYEARGRVGGRIFSIEINGRIGELGAQNITDGGEAIHLNRFIKEFGLSTNSRTVSLNYSYFDGKNLASVNEILKERNFHSQMLRRQLQELASTASNMKEVLEGIFDPQDPLYAIFATKLAAFEGGAIEDLSPLYTETLFHMLFGGICSVHPGNEEAAEASLDVMSIEGGNRQLPEKMAEALGEKLYLNSPLQRIAKNAKGQFELVFSNGDHVTADLLVLAIPCSVYDQILVEDDAIPTQTLEHIRNVQYGANAKLLIPFVHPPTQTTTLVGNEVISFFDNPQQLLTVYYTGKTSWFSPSTMSQAYRHVKPMIEKVYGDDGRSPIYAKDQSGIAYEGAVGYSWPADPYARGTYSYIAQGQEDLLTETITHNGHTFKKLFAPIDDSLYFVGEHASILFDVPGTMEAACESGERTAQAILRNRLLLEAQYSREAPQERLLNLTSSLSSI